MDYNKKISGLINEAKQLSQYKRLPVVLRIFWVYALFGLIIHDLCLIASYYVLSFIYKGLSTPFNIIHDFVNKEKEGTKDLSHAVICLVAMPLLLTYQFVLALFSFAFYILWFLIMYLTYIVTLGGIKWQPYIKEASFDDNLAGMVPAPKKKSVVKFSIFTIIFFYILPVVINVLSVISWLVYLLVLVISAALSVTGVGAVIFVLLILALYIVLIIAIPLKCISAYLYVIMAYIVTYIGIPVFFKMKPASEVEKDEPAIADEPVETAEPVND